MSGTRQLLTTAAAEIQREQIEWLEPGRVPNGLVTVLAGIGGLGKSQWTCLLASRLSLGEFGEPGATLIATAEDTPSTTVVPRLQALRANLSLIHFVTVKTKEGDEDGIELPADLSSLQQTVAALNARLLVIDPLVAHLPTTIDAHRDQSVRRALAPLYRLAQETGCAVIAVLHLNKAQALAPLARLGGSVAFGNAARSVLLLDRDPDDPDGDSGYRRVLAHIKCNVAPLAPSLLYRVEPIVLPAENNEPMVKTSRLELIGESSHDGRSLLGDEEARTALEEAVEFLSDYLADGGRYKAIDIYKEATKHRISDSTLKRAKRKIGAKSEKNGFTGGWEWWISAKSSHQQNLASSTSSSSSTYSSEGFEGNEKTTYMESEPFELFEGQRRDRTR